MGLHVLNRKNRIFLQWVLEHKTADIQSNGRANRVISALKDGRYNQTSRIVFNKLKSEYEIEFMERIGIITTGKVDYDEMYEKEERFQRRYRSYQSLRKSFSYHGVTDDNFTQLFPKGTIDFIHIDYPSLIIDPSKSDHIMAMAISLYTSIEKNDTTK